MNYGIYSLLVIGEDEETIIGAEDLAFMGS